MTFVNFTNHQSEFWSVEQRQAAEIIGAICDIAFPAVSAHLDEAGLSALAEEYAARILALQPAAVLCQGEFTLTLAVVRRLQRVGVTVLSACSERVVHETTDENGVSHKTAEFCFVQFREYERCC